ncbi:MAG: aldehyde dehydrogenase family protein, partial [Candidatus Dormibacteraeota bacterium]|nr:aldehyde dehydrogenase family protein [Candidatus Dormibacteraeota bacterium]
RDELARLLTLDQGKPLQAESYDEVDELVSMWHGAAEDAVRLEGAIPASTSADKRVLVLRRARGPIGVITPWNWPYTMPAELVAPALACGNTVVWTPAPSTSVCSALLAECVAAADLPAGVFNFVTGPGPVVGDEIAGNPLTAGVAFIGSTQTGLHVARRAAGKAQLLEMGGNGPLVVMDDADLEAAVSATMTGCFLCAGQSCTASERLLVHEAVSSEFARLLADAVRERIRLGDPFDPATTMGPLNNEGTAAKMDAHVADALARGAVALTGGARVGGFPTDLYWGATVLAGVPAGAAAATEETFGPIAPIVTISSLDEAIALTNASPFGLMSAIFTRDLASGLRFAERVQSGMVNINVTTNHWENHLPFGGGAGTASGIGRVGGRYPMETFTEVRTVIFSS